MNKQRLKDMEAILGKLSQARELVQDIVKTASASNFLDIREIKEITRSMTNAEADIQRAARHTELLALAVRRNLGRV
jgi:hypothetical protein